MPQNPEKYFYVTRVGLVRGSWALKKFEEDAERHHMADQPGKLVALRLTEYYELIERLGGQAPPPGVAISSNGHGPQIVPAPAPAPAPRSGSRRRPLDDEDESSLPQPEELQDPDAAIDESIDVWNMDT